MKLLSLKQNNRNEIFHFFLFFSLLHLGLIAQPTLQEIKKHKIKSVTEIHKTGSDVYSRKTIKNIYGHDSLIYHDGELSFYTTIEKDNKNRIVNILFYNARNNGEEEYHLFKYHDDKTYSIEIIAHGAGLIQTEVYDTYDQLLQSIDEYGNIISYHYNNNGKVEKIFQHIKNQQNVLIGITTFAENGSELRTEILGENPAVITYEHNERGLISNIMMKSKAKENSTVQEISYQFEF